YRVGTGDRDKLRSGEAVEIVLEDDIVDASDGLITSDVLVARSQLRGQQLMRVDVVIVGERYSVGTRGQSRWYALEAEVEGLDLQRAPSRRNGQGDQKSHQQSHRDTQSKSNVFGFSHCPSPLLMSSSICGRIRPLRERWRLAPQPETRQ